MSKLFTFQTSNERPISFFMSKSHSQHGISPDRHKGQFLVAVLNKKGDRFDMHIIKSPKAKIFNRAIAYGVYPVNGVSETIYPVEQYLKS
ncbi:MAG: hypothetical protein KAX53_02340 [Saprospiraceae bacterium]|nr:hypothetical protein [Saprospiraceae bacterium]